MNTSTATRAGIAAAAMIASAGIAQADVIATLSFNTPNATVASNVAIPVWVTLTLDPASDPITTDSSGHVTSPLSAMDISNLNGHSSNVIINNTFCCAGNFTSACSPAAYAFNFNFSPPSCVDPPNLSLAPGSSTSFLFGTFNPVGGNAAPGVYTFYNAQFEFEYYDSVKMAAYFSPIASTCASFNPSCAFTRTVFAAAVPEPTSWAMMILGVAGVGVALRRRGRAVA